MKKIVLASIFFAVQAIAQVPEPANAPMTAPGAVGIDLNSHVLHWKNPSDVIYNECYFSTDSMLVVNMDVSARILNGNPSTVYSSASINSLLHNTKYFWRVVEYNASGSTASPIWNFRSQASPDINYGNDFNSGLNGFVFAGPLGINNWYWSNTSGAGGGLGELVFRWDPIFIGDSYMMSPEIPAPADLHLNINFKFYEDWWSNIVVIGCAYTTDNGYTWTSIWEISANGNVGPDTVYKEVDIPGNFRLGFYFTGNSNDIDFYRIDDVTINSPVSAAYPPGLLLAQAGSDEQKVFLNWNSGSSQGSPITGYRIQRKQGFPSGNSPYVTLTSTDENTFSFEDNTVELNQTYTYRICSLSPAGHFYGNESTAYIPQSVPVELISFTADVNGTDVTLNWKTASEINNRGFDIERSEPSPDQGSAIWEKIGFVEGNGTTTDLQSYSFTERNLPAGIYNYRLKQIDLDGTFEYLNEIEAEISIVKEFSLNQNYPNPFNPSTTISFTLPDAQFVTLKIYDILGREIKSIINEKLNGGEHKFIFNASDLSSGIYFYRIAAGDNISVKTMQVLK